MSDIEALVVSTASDLLGTPVTAGDDFFQAGGDSILAMHLVGRLSRSTGTRLRVRTLLANPVLADFAEVVRAETADAAGEGAGPDAE